MSEGIAAGNVETALREMARLHQATLVEVLMREYHWTAGAAVRLAVLVASGVADRAGRAAAVREDIDRRAMIRETREHHDDTNISQEAAEQPAG